MRRVTESSNTKFISILMADCCIVEERVGHLLGHDLAAIVARYACGLEARVVPLVAVTLRSLSPKSVGFVAGSTSCPICCILEISQSADKSSLCLRHGPGADALRLTLDYPLSAREHCPCLTGIRFDCRGWTLAVHVGDCAWIGVYHIRDGSCLGLIPVSESLRVFSLALHPKSALVYVLSDTYEWQRARASVRASISMSRGAHHLHICTESGQTLAQYETPPLCSSCVVDERGRLWGRLHQNGAGVPPDPVLREVHKAHTIPSGVFTNKSCLQAAQAFMTS